MNIEEIREQAIIAHRSVVALWDIPNNDPVEFAKSFTTIADKLEKFYLSTKTPKMIPEALPYFSFYVPAELMKQAAPFEFDPSQDDYSSIHANYMHFEEDDFTEDDDDAYTDTTDVAEENPEVISSLDSHYHLNETYTYAEIVDTLFSTLGKIHGLVVGTAFEPAIIPILHELLDFNIFREPTPNDFYYTFKRLNLIVMIDDLYQNVEATYQQSLEDK